MTLLPDDSRPLEAYLPPLPALCSVLAPSETCAESSPSETAPFRWCALGLEPAIFPGGLETTDLNKAAANRHSQ
jgi:hypothetical protein